MGVDVMHYGHDMFRTVETHNRPFVCTDALVTNAHAVVSDAMELGASMSGMPIHTEADWSYPLLLQKLLRVVYAGMCWTKAGAVKMLDMHTELDQFGPRKPQGRRVGKEGVV